MRNISWCPCLKVRVNFYPEENYAAHFTVWCGVHLPVPSDSNQIQHTLALTQTLELHAQYWRWLFLVLPPSLGPH